MIRLTVLFALGCMALSAGGSAAWKFAVSGDSRNCGDVVMPAIAAGVLRDGAEFYWRLGDFRSIPSTRIWRRRPISLCLREP